MNTATHIDAVDYESLSEKFNQALIHTLRKHSIADSFLDCWVPDADPVLGIAGMVDSARIAGRNEIAIRIRRSTISAQRLPELEAAVGCFCKVTLTIQGNSIILHATGMSKSAGDTNSIRTGKTGAKPSYWQADKAVESPDVTASPTGWNWGELPEFHDAHPHFRLGLKAVVAGLRHEGDCPPAGAGTVRVIGEDGGVTLTLDVDAATHVVKAARHAGAREPSERAALELFCRTVEQLPVQEAADHAGLKVIESLVDGDRTPPVAGILLPANAGSPFCLAPRLARRAYDTYCELAALGKTDNFYYAPPAAGWLRLPSIERRAAVETGLRGFLQSEELYPDDMEILRLEKNKYGYEVRGVIGFSDRVKVDKKPFLMRRLEQRLRRDYEPTIELIADRAKDASPLRRLS